MVCMHLAVDSHLVNYKDHDEKKRPQTRLDYSDRTQCVGIVSRTVQNGLQG